jgi:hypothetical protein
MESNGWMNQPDCCDNTQSVVLTSTTILLGITKTLVDWPLSIQSSASNSAVIRCHRMQCMRIVGRNPTNGCENTTKHAKWYGSVCLHANSKLLLKESLGYRQSVRRLWSCNRPCRLVWIAWRNQATSVLTSHLHMQYAVSIELESSHGFRLRISALAVIIQQYRISWFVASESLE